jgi:hypothetical protein
LIIRGTAKFPEEGDPLAPEGRGSRLLMLMGWFPEKKRDREGWQSPGPEEQATAKPASLKARAQPGKKPDKGTRSEMMHRKKAWLRSGLAALALVLAVGGCAAPSGGYTEGYSNSWQSEQMGIVPTEPSAESTNLSLWVDSQGGG